MNQSQGSQDWDIILTGDHLLCSLYTDNLHSKATLPAEFIKLSEDLRARALQDGKVNEVFQ